MDSVLIILLQVQYKSAAIVFKVKNNPQGWVWIMEFLLMENVYMLSFCKMVGQFSLMLVLNLACSVFFQALQKWRAY